MVKKVVVEEPPPVCALSKKEAKKVEKIRSRIEYHKCRVSNFKGPCPDKAEQLASVARLEKEMAEIELGAKRRDPQGPASERRIIRGESINEPRRRGLKGRRQRGSLSTRRARASRSQFDPVKGRARLWLEPEMPVVTGVKAEMVKA
mmetsp:Transcript_28760/g.101851  ORF Transcript_28760/g.101851 Transcript_28760/m.101851 type:complete len:147 (-) Transcript_28760:187-627(-)